MKVIFTNVDGVLNEGTTLTRTKNGRILADKDKILRLLV